MASDITSLADQSLSPPQKITSLLGTTLGLINIERNGIIKIVSVATVVFLPSTLIVSIYGMDFQLLPEQKWFCSYP